jgi:hypothetical protein
MKLICKKLRQFTCDVIDAIDIKIDDAFENGAISKENELQ